MGRTGALCDDVPALAGHRVGVTADRRAAEQGELLRRMGAEVVHGAALRTLPLADERPTRDATMALLADPPTMVLLTTGIGLRSWLGAAETWGVGDELLKVLGAVPIYARGPKAFAAALQVGLPVFRREPTERLHAMVRALVADRVDGEHIAIQLHGGDEPAVTSALAAAGARVTEVPVYRWVPPEDEGPARRLVREAIEGQLTVVTFTSPSSVISLCRIAEADGALEALVASFRTRVAAACVGPATEDAALARGIRVACAPDVGRLGLLVRELGATLADRHVHLRTPSGEARVQGSLVIADDGVGGRVELSLPDRERQVLAVLAARTGRVVAREVIEREVWGSTDEDRALDAALSRLRRSLAPAGLEIATRVRRGYQLVGEPLPCRSRVAATA